MHLQCDCWNTRANVRLLFTSNISRHCFQYIYQFIKHGCLSVGKHQDHWEEKQMHRHWLQAIISEQHWVISLIWSRSGWAACFPMECTWNVRGCASHAYVKCIRSLWHSVTLNPTKSPDPWSWEAKGACIPQWVTSIMMDLWNIAEGSRTLAHTNEGRRLDESYFSKVIISP